MTESINLIYPSNRLPNIKKINRIIKETISLIVSINYKDDKTVCNLLDKVDIKKKIELSKSIMNNGYKGYKDIYNDITLVIAINNLVEIIEIIKELLTKLLEEIVIYDSMYLKTLRTAPYSTTLTEVQNKCDVFTDRLNIVIGLNK